MPHTPDAVRTTAVNRLLAARDDHGHIPDAAVDRVAATLGRTPRTIRRWVADSHEWKPSTPANLDPEIIAEALAVAGNNATKAHRILVNNGVEMPSVRTFRRWVAADHKQVRSFLADGEKGLRNSQLYTRWEAPHRNHTWQSDHVEIPVHALPRSCSKPRKPYLTVHIDDATRMCMGFGFDFRGRGGAEMIVAVLAKAVEIRPSEQGGRLIPGGDVGGSPLFIRHDQGADYTSKRVGDVLVAFDIERSETIGYSPWLKGKIERFFLTAEADFFSQLPGYAGAGSDHKGRSVLAGDDADLLTDDELVARFTAWVQYYNYVRPHRSLGGRTPFEAWIAECHSPLREVPADAQRMAMLPVPGTRTVQKDGIHHNNDIYFAPELPAVGTETTIRHLPHDERTVEVYVDGEWICTAVQQRSVTTAQRRSAQARRTHETRHVRRAASNGRRQRSLDVLAMPTAETDDVPVITAEADNDGDDGDAATLPRVIRSSAGSALLDMYESAEEPQP